eukprot:gene17072-18792_t
MANLQRIVLNDGIKIPLFGIGLYNVTESVLATIKAAVDNGYRLFDTATYYENEQEVGQALRSSGLDRKDYFIVTKLWISEHGYEKTKAAFRSSLEKLGLDYIDLYLIHSPSGGKIIETWKAMTELKKAGLTRSIGVSNFNTHHLERLKDGCSQLNLPLPSINQIELHPWLQQRTVVNYCQKLGIHLMGFCPLGRCAKFGKDAVLVDVAKKWGKTQAQILVRWGMQKDFVTIPKSSKAERIKENADVFDFALSDDEMEMLDGLEEGMRVSSTAITRPWVE